MDATINYHAIRTRYINFDQSGPLFDKNFNLIGMNSQFRLDHNVAARVDVVKDCFTELNAVNLAHPNCLRDWKFFNHRDLGVKFPTAAAYNAAMQGYQIPNPMLISEPSTEWPELPLDTEFVSE
jgi:hypothetical protein